jgi:hypothetical protein
MHYNGTGLLQRLGNGTPSPSFGAISGVSVAQLQRIVSGDTI